MAGMKHIIEGAEKLRAEIRGCEVFKEYLAARADVDAEPILAAKLAEYKGLVQELAGAGGDEHELMPHRQRVSAAYFEAASDGMLFRFLEAERAAVALVCDVLEIIAGDDIRI